MTALYCLEHEHSVKAESSVVGICHEYPTYDEFGRLDWDWCFFNCGWATNEPPTNFEDDLLIGDWDTYLVEPDEEEEMISWDEFNQAVLDGAELERWMDAENEEIL
jgi:hypothetical protein